MTKISLETVENENNNLGSENNPVKLPELVVYPKYAQLDTYYPFYGVFTKGPKYIPGHSKISIINVDPYKDQAHSNRVVNKQTNSPGYNLITNNCANNTKCVIDAIFNQKSNLGYIVTPGEVQDLFKEKGAIIHNVKNGKVTYRYSLSDEEYNRAINAVDSIRDVESNIRKDNIHKKRDKRWNKR